MAMHVYEELAKDALGGSGTRLNRVVTIHQQLWLHNRHQPFTLRIPTQRARIMLFCVA